MKEHVHTILTDFWWVVVTPVAIWLSQHLVRWMFGRVIKSYEQEIESLNETVKNMKTQQSELKARIDIFEKEYPTISYVDGIEKRITAKHDKMETLASEQHMQQRQDIKQLGDRIDGLVNLIVDKLH